MPGHPFLIIRHNIEVAHRLFQTSGKCENIHGHSMWIDLKLFGFNLKSGMMTSSLGEPLEFGMMKERFRKHLDTTYDHHLLLNVDDPWTQPLQSGTIDGEKLPGLQAFDGDPTTENIACKIAKWSAHEFDCDAEVIVHETAVNAAGAIAYYRSKDD